MHTKAQKVDYEMSKVAMLDAELKFIQATYL